MLQEETKMRLVTGLVRHRFPVNPYKSRDACGVFVSQAH